MKTHKFIFDQFSFSLNEVVDLKTITIGSGREFFWECSHGSDHVWRASIAARLRYPRCPFCSNKRLSETNNLLARYPAIAAEWHPVKNGDLRPENVVYGSSKSVWWKCLANEEHDAWKIDVCVRTSQGHGCPSCGVLVAAKKIKKTTDEYRKELYELSGGKITITQDYLHSTTSIVHKCLICDYEWKIKPTNMLADVSCRRCAKKPTPMTEAEFICEAIKIHGDRYGYSELNYACKSEPAIIFCKTCNQNFSQRPYLHLRGAGGCPTCSRSRHRTPEEYDELLKIKTSGKIVAKEAYKNNYTAILHICNSCRHEWMVSPASIIKGLGNCPKCVNKVSSIEELWLNIYNIPKDVDHRQVQIKLGQTRYTLDGYEPSTATAFEFLGNYYHGNPTMFASNGFNHKSKKTFGELFEKTREKFESLRVYGITVVYVWEKDFNNGMIQSHGI